MATEIVEGHKDLVLEALFWALKNVSRVINYQDGCREYYDRDKEWLLHICESRKEEVNVFIHDGKVIVRVDVYQSTYKVTEKARKLLRDAIDEVWSSHHFPNFGEKPGGLLNSFFKSLNFFFV
ncbi:MAG: hypothetical protein QXE05_05555 [Nitrososphaeria archaeon]